MAARTSSRRPRPPRQTPRVVVLPPVQPDPKAVAAALRWLADRAKG